VALAFDGSGCHIHLLVDFIIADWQYSGYTNKGVLCMKLTITKKITLDLTLDSSETIMFTQGGKHKIDLNTDEDLSEYNQIEITVQMERNAQGRFDFITGQAAKHREAYDNENKCI
jgi:hypothetical protein